jgi:hypothetical protein
MIVVETTKVERRIAERRMVETAEVERMVVEKQMSSSAPSSDEERTL